jgi:hypothetical protein
MPSTSIPVISSDSSNAFLFVSVMVLLIILMYPWIIGLVSLSLVTGYYSLEFMRDKVKPVLLQRFKYLTNRPSGAGAGTAEDVAFDPLLHTSPSDDGTGKACSVCSVENCSRGLHEKPKRTLSSHNRLEQDFKISPQLNISVTKFCSAVFDNYINPAWAPYETRRQLRLAFTKLLIRFAKLIKKSFVLKEGNPHLFCKDKVIPLLLYHLEEQRRGSGGKGKKLSAMDEKRANWKVRRLSQAVLEKCLSPEDQKCKLWTELCISVLGDGVLWNLILMGRLELPELLETYLVQLLDSLVQKPTVAMPAPVRTPPAQQVRNPLQDFEESEADGESGSSETVPQIQIQTFDEPDSKNEPSRSDNDKEVPFLLETFLDPVHDVEQPASIVSRWRPTLNDILQERDLLYCIIQYLKDQSALEYLQAVMDESPDGSTYCRKILELKYLPGFCRSKIFLENLGLSRVDLGLEAGTESNENNGSK